MKLRIAFIPLALTLISGSASQAQTPRQGGAEGRTQMLFKDITLTTAQQAKVDSIVGHYRSQMSPMTPGTPRDSATMAARRALIQKQNADLRLVLTKEQLPVFDRNVEEMRVAMQRRTGRTR